MECKRGQVSIYVIIGIVVLLIVGIVYYVQSYAVSSVQTSPAEVENVKVTLESCVDQVAQDGLRYLSLHGGYSAIGDDFSTNGLPYYYKNNVTSIPEKSFLEEEMNKYVTVNVNDCFKDVIVENLDVSSKLDVDKFNVILDYNIVVNIKGISYTLSPINIALDTRLSDMYDNAKFIVEDLAANEGWSCISCVNDNLKSYGFQLYNIYTPEGMMYSVINGEESFDFMVEV